MSLRSPADDQTALTLTLSHRNGRGNFSTKSTKCSPLLFLPSPACGRGKGEGPCARTRIVEGVITEPSAENRGTQIGLEYVFDPKKLQHLRWRWRVRALPVGADERVAEKHDAAAQVYVIFDNQYWPRIIKFTWSTAAPVGSRFTHPLYHRARVVVLRTGPPDKSGWYEEKVNFYAEYKKFFGTEPGQVQGIAILTSSDSTKSVAAADYDDFVLVP